MSTSPKSAGLVPASEMAEWIGIVPSSLPDLASKGHVVRASHGKYQLKESVQAYTRYQRARASGLKASDSARTEGDAKSRREEAEARLAEAEVAKVEAEWLPVDMIVRAYAERDVVIRTKLLSIESKVPPESRAATRKAIHEALTELADHNPEEIVTRVTAEVCGGTPPPAEPDAQ